MRNRYPTSIQMMKMPTINYEDEEEQDSSINHQETNVDNLGNEETDQRSNSKNREVNQPEENREVNQPEEYRTRYGRRVIRT